MLKITRTASASDAPFHSISERTCFYDVVIRAVAVALIALCVVIRVPSLWEKKRKGTEMRTLSFVFHWLMRTFFQVCLYLRFRSHSRSSPAMSDCSHRSAHGQTDKKKIEKVWYESGSGFIGEFTGLSKREKEGEWEVRIWIFTDK